MAQNLGSMGEKFFHFLCSSEGVNCNASEEDMAGWDYILDFPLESNISASDSSAPPIECKIQIKSTTKTRRYSDIKLSNLLRFCKTPLPAFILFMEFDSKKTPQRLYLVHFDKDLIKDSLIAIRTAEQGKTKKKLHRSSMRIKYNESHRLDSVDGISLKLKIESYMPSGLSAYSLDKINYNNEVGYENSAGFLKFHTDNQDAFLKMIEASIGIDREIEVKDIEISSSRFDIKLAEPIHQAKSGVLKVHPGSNFFSVTVRFKENLYSSPIEFMAKAYYPPLPDIPKELLRIRIKTAFFELVLGMGERASTYQMSMDDEKHSLQDLEAQSKLLNWMCYEKKKLYVDFISIDNPCLKNSMIITPTQDEVHSGKDEWTEELKTIQNLIWLTTRFGVASLLKVSLNEIYHKREKINKFYDLYMSKPGEIVFNFTSDGDYKDENLKLTHSITYSFPLAVAGAFMVLIISFQGNATKLAEGDFVLVVNDLIIEREIVTFDQDEDFRSHVKSEMTIVNKKYIDEGMLVINNKMD